MRVYVSHERQTITEASNLTIYIISVQLECITQAIEGGNVMCKDTSKGETSSFVISTLHTLEPIDGVISVLVLVPTDGTAAAVVKEYQRFSKYLDPVKVICFMPTVNFSHKIVVKGKYHLLIKALTSSE